MASFLGNLASGVGSGLLQYAAIQQKGTMDAIRQESLEKRWKRQDDMAAQQASATAEHRANVLAEQKATREALGEYRADVLEETTRHNKATEANSAAATATRMAAAAKDLGMDENEYVTAVFKAQKQLEEANLLAEKPLSPDEIQAEAIRQVAQARSKFKDGGESSQLEVPDYLSQIIQANPAQFKGLSQADAMTKAQQYFQYLQSQKSKQTPPVTPHDPSLSLNPLEGDENQIRLGQYLQGYN